MSQGWTHCCQPSSLIWIWWSKVNPCTSLRLNENLLDATVKIDVSAVVLQLVHLARESGAVIRKSWAIFFSYVTPFQGTQSHQCPWTFLSWHLFARTRSASSHAMVADHHCSFLDRLGSIFIFLDSSYLCFKMDSDPVVDVDPVVLVGEVGLQLVPRLLFIWQPWCDAADDYMIVVVVMMMKMLLVRVVHLTVDSKLMINSFKPPDKNWKAKQNQRWKPRQSVVC